MRYNAIPSELFKKNREKVLAKLPSQSCAIFYAQDAMPRNGDIFYPYRQNSDFFYLSGINQENSILILLSRTATDKPKSILCITPHNKETEIWEGKKLCSAQASAISGISEVIYTNQSNELISDILATYNTVYVNKNENPRFSSPVISADERYARELQSKYPAHAFVSIAPIMQECRIIKEPEEIDIISHAAAITTSTFIDVVPRIPHLHYEYEVEALITQGFLQRAAKGHAFEPIIAAGANACYLHYVYNNCKLQAGDMLLMDFGAEYANYASDATRVVPINGKFSARQKEVYQSVLHILKESTNLLAEGTTLANVQQEVVMLMQEELLKLKLLSKHDIRTNPQAYKNYFMHGVSHFLGLDTHDVGTREHSLQEGMVVTCEPGIYIAEEGIGIRLENDILITSQGNENLLANMPIEINDIENLF